MSNAYNMEKFYNYDGRQTPFILNAFSAGGGNSIVITAMRPDLVQRTNAFDPPGTKALVDMFSAGDPSISETIRAKVTIYPVDPNIVNTVGEHPDGVKMFHIPLNKHSIKEMVYALKNYGVTEINKKFYDGKGFIDEQGYYHIARLGATSAEIAKEFNVAIDRVQAGETPFSQLNPGNKLLNTFKINLRYTTNNDGQ